MDKIGILNAYIETWKYNQDTQSLHWVKNPLNYRPCTRQELMDLGPEILKYYTPDLHEDVFCFENDQDINIWNNNAADWQQLGISLTPCVGSNCYDQAKLDERLNQIFGFFFYKSQQFKKQEYEFG